MKPPGKPNLRGKKSIPNEKNKKNNSYFCKELQQNGHDERKQAQKHPC